MTAPRHERFARQIADEANLHGRLRDEVVAVLDRRLAGWEAMIEAQTRRPFEELFSGGPDTACRTVWRREAGPLALSEVVDVPLTECVEVPLDDLRDAFRAAGGQA